MWPGATSLTGIHLWVGLRGKQFQGFLDCKVLVFCRAQLPPCETHNTGIAVCWNLARAYMEVVCPTDKNGALDSCECGEFGLLLELSAQYCAVISIFKFWLAAK